MFSQPGNPSSNPSKSLFLFSKPSTCSILQEGREQLAVPQKQPPRNLPTPEACRAPSILVSDTWGQLPFQGSHIGAAGCKASHDSAESYTRLLAFLTSARPPLQPPISPTRTPTFAKTQTETLWVCPFTQSCPTPDPFISFWVSECPLLPHSKHLL